MEENYTQKIPRRGFFRMVFGSIIGLAGLASVPFIISSIIPRKVVENKRIRIGKAAGFPVNQMTYLPTHHLFILRDPDGIAAMSAVCTHLGCVVEKDASGFQCPCHGSCYTPEGTVLTGPAPRNLPWFEIVELPDKSLLVNLDKQVSPGYRLIV